MLVVNDYNEEGCWRMEVTIIIHGKTTKMASQQKDEKDVIIFTEQFLFNIWVRREIRNTAVMKEFNRALILW